MTRIRAALRIAVVTIAAFALFALPAAAGTAAAPREVHIGGTLPLSGPDGVAGNKYLEGYRLAVDEANAKGGVALGAGTPLPVRLVVHDDHNDRATAVSIADGMLSRREVDVLLGTYSSANVEAQAEVAERHRVPLVSGAGAAAPLFQHGYHYLFGLMSPVKLLATAELGWVEAAQKQGKLPSELRIALLWEDTVHGQDYRAGVLKAVERSRGGLRLVVDESFPLGMKEWKAPVQRLAAAHADVLLADAHLLDFIALHKQVLAAGLCHSVVSYGARGPEKEARQALGDEAVKYILSAAWWNDQLGSHGLNKAFVDAFRKKHGRNPEWYQALAYEAARVALTALEQSGSVDGEALRTKLATMQIETILPGGKLNFPPEYGQQAHYPFVVQQNLPDGSSPIVYPEYLASQPGVVPDPRCARAASAAVMRSE